MDSLKQRIKQLEEENKYLRKLLGLSENQEILARKSKVINNLSSTEDKIKLFRSLFKGREDFFAQRWENKGVSGYSPVCNNKWVKPKCGLPKIKCVNCQYRDFKPISDRVIYNHLSGVIVVGIYPIMDNDCCRFLAIDFDKKDWKKDVLAVYSTCMLLNIPSSIEISRSGKGAHLWIFFSEDITALLARKLGAHIISETLKTGNLLDLESYDRMFPNQDYLPEGGFGNLIALPLQKRARSFNGSVFVDTEFKPFKDQWAYLSLVNRLTKNDVDDILRNKEIIIPVCDTNQRQKISIILSNQIYISKNGLPKHLYHKLLQLAVFSNPEFYIAQASRRSTHKIPRFIQCGNNLPQMLCLPTGLYEKVIETIVSNKLRYVIHDQRNKGKKIDCSFQGKLFPKQVQAFNELIKHEMSVLCASTGFGKTVLATKIICERKVNTLILVHRTELLNQWKEKLKIFTAGCEIGTLGATKSNQTLQIDIAMIQTLKNVSAQNIDQYGQIIIDECHHIAAFTFENILKKSKAKYILGMSATPNRKDGHHPIVFMQCGQIKYRSTTKLSFDSMIAYKIETGSNAVDGNITLAKQLSILSEDFNRNNKICNDIAQALDKGRKPLLLTERVSHLKILEEKLSPICDKIIVLKGNMKTKAKETTKNKLASLSSNDKFIIIATGKYIGEGFDLPILDTLFLALPISWKGTLNQYIGRIVRTYENKTSIEVYDYVDGNIERLSKMYNKRKKAYKSLGFSIIDKQSSLI